MKMKRIVTILTALLCCALLVCACGQTEEAGSQQVVGSGLLQELIAEDAAVTGEGMINTFIGEPFYDGTVTDEESADAAVRSVYDRIGADETTILQLGEVTNTEENTYYTFYQNAGDIRVHGATVKLIVDKDGKAIGLVSSIVPNLSNTLSSPSITAEEAENIVTQVFKDDGKEVTVIPNATAETLLPAEEGSALMKYVWMVYTNNIYPEFDTAYLVSYVTEDGTYLSSMPVMEPGNADALHGDISEFAFADLQPNDWEGTITHTDGTQEQVTLPVLYDPENNLVYLADGERRILCADYSDFIYNDTLTPRSSTDGTFANDELLTYYNMIRIYDWFDSVGWKGTDGEGTPMLLLMDMVDENGEVVDNAVYAGRSRGFQLFFFNRDHIYGDCIDVTAHEFTHGFTDATMTTCIYKDEYGAINEGMSDVIGNAIEMILSDNEDGYWLLGENAGEPMRSMSDPRKYDQPEYTWDPYYVPHAKVGSKNNDMGGVHTNSSLLNLVSYKLYQAGMQPEDQLYYWMNVALALTPRTDYEMLAQLLPWCLRASGYAQYEDALVKAIEEARYTLTEFPEKPEEGMGGVRFFVSNSELYDANDINFAFYDPQTDQAYESYPDENLEVKKILPASSYLISAFCTDRETKEMTSYIYLSDGSWIKTDLTDPSEITAQYGDNLIEIPEGQVTILKDLG